MLTRASTETWNVVNLGVVPGEETTPEVILQPDGATCIDVLDGGLEDARPNAATGELADDA